MWNQMTVEKTLKTIRKNDPLDDLHGWLLVDKPNGLGSTKVVEVIKKKIGILYMFVYKIIKIVNMVGKQKIEIGN